MESSIPFLSMLSLPSPITVIIVIYLHSSLVRSITELSETFTITQKTQFLYSPPESQIAIQMDDGKLLMCQVSTQPFLLAKPFGYTTGMISTFQM